MHPLGELRAAIGEIIKTAVACSLERYLRGAQRKNHRPQDRVYEPRNVESVRGPGADLGLRHTTSDLTHTQAILVEDFAEPRTFDREERLEADQK